VGISGDVDKFRRFVGEFKGGARSKFAAAAMSGVRGSVQARIKDQFARGVGPDDSRHKPRKDGRPALVSRRLGNAARARVLGTALWVEPKTPHVGDILDTQQDGHTFPKREGGKVYQYRDRKGRLIGYWKFVRRIAKGRSDAFSERSGQGVYEKNYYSATRTGRLSLRASRAVISGVKFGPRTLPSRPIRPVGSLTRPWQQAVADGITAGAEKRLGKYQ